jgi:hypothetical protein
MIPAKIRAQVVASRPAQGLPGHVADQAFLDRLAVHILAARSQHNGGPGTRRGRRDHLAAAKEAKGRCNATP